MIVSCGEALIDFVPERTAAGEHAYVPRAGGSPFNVALTVGRLGVPAGFLGSVSTDFFGTQLVNALRASGVDTRYVSRLERPSTLAFVSLDTVEPEYTFYDTGAANVYWAPSDELSADVTMLHFGSLSLIHEPAADNYAALMQRMKGRAILSLDPNIRPTVVRGKELGYRARLDAMLALADIVKISAADLDWLERGHDSAHVAAGWVHAGASLVVVTAGADGSTAYARGGRRVHAAARPIALVDTVGAGDSFMGALLTGLATLGAATTHDVAALDDADIASVLGFAAEVSAITCSRAGADPPRRGEVTFPARSSGAKGTP